MQDLSRYCYHLPFSRMAEKAQRFVNRGFVYFRDRMFRRFVYWAIRFRYPVWAAAFLLLAVSVSAVIDQTVRWRFFVPPERGTVTARGR